MAEKRNIILITFDSLRADHCSFMGYHRKTTPTLDKMAKKGLYFTNAIASGVPTPISMTGVFTGNYSWVDSSSQNPALWRRELNKRKTLAQVLRQIGYTTGAIHENAYVSKYFGFNKGFDYYNDSPTNAGIKPKIHNIISPIFKKIGFSAEVADVLLGIGTCSKWELYYNKIVDWVYKTKEPFFLWVLLLDTHTPYLPPRKFRKNITLFQMYYCAWKLGKYLRCGDRTIINDNLRQKIIDIYDSSIQYADLFVNNLWKDVQDYDPIFIIHADHGDGFGEHGFYQHVSPHWLYEELVHVPLIIFNSNLKGRIDSPVSLLGVAPTILELINVKNKFPSKSILNNNKNYVVSIVSNNSKTKLAVRTKKWKYITGQKEVDELYNLKKDPHEQENIIYDNPDIAKDLQKTAKKSLYKYMELNTIKNKVKAFGDKI